MAQVLLGLELAEIRELLPQQPGFRARQIYEAVYIQRIQQPGDILTLPAPLRLELNQACTVGMPKLDRRYESSDGTIRYLLTLDDGRTVESVYMPEEARDTICISTQVGCAVDCKFCMTGLLGFERNLTAGEILGQVLYAAKDKGLAPSDRRVNVVLMGMGEPLLNLEAVLKATRLLTDPKGVGLSPRRITLSTSGIIPRIEELGRAPVRPKLAISLNASSEEQRRELMPVTRKYHLKDLLEACRAYPLRPWERLTFEYALLKGVNDTDADARRVVRLLANLKCKMNLIALNPGPGIPFESPDPERVLSFQSIVRRALPCFLRKPRGRDIYAACGQLKRVSL
jgi:23S rRNA (adenine2503-C2)-methyltransferase